ARQLLAGHLVDAIDRTDLDAGFATRAVVGTDDGQFFRQLLSRLTGPFGHGRFSRRWNAGAGQPTVILEEIARVCHADPSRRRRGWVFLWRQPRRLITMFQGPA